MRVDDNDAERRQQEIRAEERKLAAKEQQRRTAEATAFDRALARRQPEVSREEAAASDPSRKEAREAPKRRDARFRSRLGSKLGASPKPPGDEGAPPAHPRAAEVRDEAHGDASAPYQAQAEQLAARGREVDHRAGEALSGRRGEDAAADLSLSEKAQGTLREGEGRLGGRRADQKSQARLEAQRGGPEGHGATPHEPGRVGGVRDQKRGGGDRQQQGQDAKQPGAFRLPPAALMAPPPVARPKQAAGSSRLRDLAQEIAEKIVQNVRVGTNRLGLPEFQIELKSEILKGLKVKVSGRHGRIRALFASADRKVLEQLSGELESLREALTSRGLQVDALELEEERG